MIARKIYETIEFKRGQDPKKSLGLGDCSDNPELIQKNLEILGIDLKEIYSRPWGSIRVDKNYIELSLPDIESPISLEMTTFFGYSLAAEPHYSELFKAGWYLSIGPEIEFQGIKCFSLAKEKLLEKLKTTESEKYG